MFVSFVKYFPILCFPDTHFLIREGPNITPYATDLMVRAKKILGHEGRCVTDICDCRVALATEKVVMIREKNFNLKQSNTNLIFRS